MGEMATPITSLTSVYSSVYTGADQRKISKLRVTGLCEGNSPVTGEFPAQRASNAENVSIWWSHHIVFNGAVIESEIYYPKKAVLFSHAGRTIVTQYAHAM